MTQTKAVCNSFREELVRGIHNFTSDVFRVALYDSDSTLNKNTTAYSTDNEIDATNYTAGGYPVMLSIRMQNDQVFLDGLDVVVPNITHSDIGGALLYNSTKQNRAVITYSAPDIRVDGSLTLRWSRAPVLTVS